MAIDKKFIVQLQGKDFVTYEGLLDEAHKIGLKEIRTEIVQIPTLDNSRCIMKASIATEDKHFDGYGDADQSNVNRNISKHIIRMAETRAKARALRDLTNIGMTAVEELGADNEQDEPAKQKPSKISKQQASELYKLTGKDEELFRKVLDELGYQNSTDIEQENYKKVAEKIGEMKEAE